MEQPKSWLYLGNNRPIFSRGHTVKFPLNLFFLLRYWMDFHQTCIDIVTTTTWLILYNEEVRYVLVNRIYFWDCHTNFARLTDIDMARNGLISLGMTNIYFLRTFQLCNYFQPCVSLQAGNTEKPLQKFLVLKNSNPYAFYTDIVTIYKTYYHDETQKHSHRKKLTKATGNCMIFPYVKYFRTFHSLM